MDKRLTFNEDVANYDKWRPRYCPQLFSDIIEYAKLSKNHKAIEVGIGTGQATLPFLSPGCEVTAIELGENLAKYSKEKFKAYPNFKIHNTSFEDFECNDNSFNILYSATAFHWIKEDIGYPKTYRLLKHNGTLALFWNRPSANEDDPIHHKIQSIYQKNNPFQTKENKEDSLVKYERVAKTVQSYGFRDFKKKSYHQTRTFNSTNYISLLNTYSGHIALPDNIKQPLYREIQNAILENGNAFTLYDTMDLYLMRK